MLDSSTRRLLESEASGKTGEGLAESELHTVETELGVRVPSSFRSFLADFGWCETACLTVFGAGVSVPPWLNVVDRTRELRDQSGSQVDGVIAVGELGNGDIFCMGNNADPRVYLWDHERNIVSAWADSFDEFLRRSLGESDSPEWKDDLSLTVAALRDRSIECGSGVSEGVVAVAEATLGVRFPAAFRAWLFDVGWISDRALCTYGLGGPSAVDLVMATQSERAGSRPLPGHLVVIRRLDDGDLKCLAVDGEPGADPVVWWATPDEGGAFTISPSGETFVRGLWMRCKYG